MKFMTEIDQDLDRLANYPVGRIEFVVGGRVAVDVQCRQVGDYDVFSVQAYANNDVPSLVLETGNRVELKERLEGLVPVYLQAQYRGAVRRYVEEALAA